MKKLIIITAIIFLLPLVFAATDTNNVDDVFRVNSLVNYKKACFNNGTYCSSSSVCNYTIYNPDNSVLINNQRATNNGSYHNLTFYVDDIGIYQVDMICNDDSLNGAETLYFEVTGSGFNDTYWFYILIISISFGTMLLGFKLLDPTIVILGSFGLYFLGIYILFYGIAGIKDVTTTWPLGIITLGLAFYISTKSAYELITSSGY